MARREEYYLERIGLIQEHLRREGIPNALKLLDLPAGAEVHLAVLVPGYDPFRPLAEQFAEERAERRGLTRSVRRGPRVMRPNARELASAAHSHAWTRSMLGGDEQGARERLARQAWAAISHVRDMPALGHALVDCFALGSMEIDAHHHAMASGGLLITLHVRQRAPWEIPQAGLIGRVHDRLREGEG